MITSGTPSFINSLAICSWTLWAVALVSVISRFISRRLQTGPSFFRDLLADDYLMIVAFACLTGVVISSNEVAKNGSNYVPEGETDDWTPAEVSQAEWGSKMLVALEEFMVGALWLVKACLLLLYARMTYVYPLASDITNATANEFKGPGFAKVLLSKSRPGIVS